MYSLQAKLSFYIPHATSLKDKRQICRSAVEKARHKFNAAIAEVDTLDHVQSLTIGIAVISSEAGHVRELLETVIRFLENNTDGELMDVEEL